MVKLTNATKKLPKKPKKTYLCRCSVAPVGIFTPKLQPRYRSGTYERHLMADYKKAPEFRLLFFGIDIKVDGLACFKMAALLTHSFQ